MGLVGGWDGGIEAGSFAAQARGERKRRASLRMKDGGRGCGVGGRGRASGSGRRGRRRWGGRGRRGGVECLSAPDGGGISDRDRLRPTTRCRMNAVLGGGPEVTGLKTSHYLLNEFGARGRQGRVRCRCRLGS